MCEAQGDFFFEMIVLILETFHFQIRYFLKCPRKGRFHLIFLSQVRTNIWEWCSLSGPVSSGVEGWHFFYVFSLTFTAEYFVRKKTRPENTRDLEIIRIRISLPHGNFHIV